jgi:hypothetical protein
MLSPFEIFLFVLVLYMLPLYMFLGPGLVGYIAAKHNTPQKGLHILAFFIFPIAMPIALIGILTGAALLFFILLVVYIFYWIKMHLPFGIIFKAWYRISLKLLNFTRNILESFLQFILPTNQAERPANNLSFPLETGND